MDTSWWPAVAAVVAVALVVLVAGGRLGLARRSPPAHGSGPPPRPRSGELWSLADGRMCLVLAVESVRGHRARVAWITGKYDDRRAGVIPLPPGTVGSQGRARFLEADRPAEVSLWEFRSRLGLLDPAVWDEVKGLGGGK
uniref:Type II toxin-antitoxin system PemK/MazF family toxin n=1 Tax=Streptomyces sp. NBC_00049 TaxID=2903617 RepID=A0AAU2JQ77_9ACTN